MRLNKYVALALGVSRREADEMVLAGRVEQRGEEVWVDGKAVKPKPYVYLALHKPTGYVSSRRAQTAAPTIYELLPEKYHHLKPVGRLDKDSSGLILLTNDGDYAQAMTHPRYAKMKLYEVTLDRALQPLHHQMIADYGVKLTDGVSKFEMASLADKKHWLVTLKEGRNRQIRRTFGALGYTVTGLHRTQFGSFALDGLAPGEFTEIQPVQ
jgi:23S rRNA pseudouridine2605 synthase